jgi:heat shock protein HslJ
MTNVRRALIAFLLALTACDSSVLADRDPDPIVQHDWLAQSVAGESVANPERVTLSIANGTVSGRGGCNQYSGPVEYGNGRIKIGPMISTKMACQEGGLMQFEQKYLNALQSAYSYSVTSGPELTITTANGALVFSAVPRQSRP